MDSERWQKLDALYHAALDRRPEERASFLVDACPHDEELRSEVESLLKEDAQNGGFLEHAAIQDHPGSLAGRSLKHYQITSLLGVGGMAEVYRARDTTLDRDVAIKVLRDAISFAPDRLERFYREARALASLHHPNISSIFALEEDEGISALVLELVEGETLAERIIRQRPDLDESLGIAKQIAAALDVAHAKGVIHRDLKPSNIKIAPDGTVKVLDFGLAKLFHARDERFKTPNWLSTAGLPILGTVPYMSPEQARGKSVDQRSDIWAWGCVFYEMLTGFAAFEGASPADLIAKIASEDPDWTRLPESTPARVCSLLKRCFEKDAERRIQSSRDLLQELEAITQEPAAGQNRNSRFRWIITFVAAAVSVAVLLVWGSKRSVVLDETSSVLAGYWPADGDALDSTGGHNGLVVGDVGFSAGVAGQAFKLNGGGYIDLGLWPSASKWTLEAWVNADEVQPPDSKGPRRNIVGDMSVCKDWGLVFINTLSNDGATPVRHFGVQTHPADGKCTASVRSNFGAAPGKWYHIASTIDGTTAKIYVNGTLRGSGPIGTDFVWPNRRVVIGREPWCDCNSFAGLVDEVRLFNRALSDAEVAAHAALYSARTR